MEDDDTGVNTLISLTARGVVVTKFLEIESRTLPFESFDNEPSEIQKSLEQLIKDGWIIKLDSILKARDDISQAGALIKCTEPN